MVHIFSYARETILLFLIVPLAHAQTVSFDYPRFSGDRKDLPELEGDAVVEDYDVIRLTRYPPDPDKASGVGRVRSHKLIKLYDNKTNQLYDFSTKFSFIIFSNHSKHGDGLAFFLASSKLPATNYTGGGGAFGLMHAKEVTIKSAEYSFVAVEFDTYHNYWDPNVSHVGVNINSVVSDRHIEWYPDVSKRKIYDCSIEYSSRNKILNVSFTGYRLNEGQEEQSFSHTIDLREHLPHDVFVGISASTGTVDEEHLLQSWSFSTCCEDTHEKKSITRLLEVLGSGVLIISLSCIILLFIALWKKNKGKEEETTMSETTSDQNMDEEFQMGAGPKKISYQELLDATNNFEETLKLGQGGFGGVYKGHFKDTDSVAAIKRRISTNARQGIKQYSAEVKIISQLRHRNLVKLNGWCHKKNELILIYEYMPNGSLDFHLFRGGSILSWHLRYNIALGLASALLYLQEEWEKCVIHRDIKSSNIMLDSNFNTKLGDFGLARMMDHEKGSETTVVAGTRGYLAPEYMDTGKARKESDIFSFGVVLLEIACGKKAIHYQELEGEVSLVEWVWELYGLKIINGAADPKLYGQFDVKELECLLVVGLWCANPDSTSRPSIKKVIKALNFETPLPILPQNMPSLAPLTTTTTEQFLSVPSFFRFTG
ncbi:L-type lectin-domain containing receptor kinase IX.1 [Trifolium repens]|nr:L-type lectin-domain containing receptor kinase IX.1 [Trifolium repens]